MQVIANTIEIGSNLNTVLVLLIAALPAMLSIIFGKKAKDAADASTTAVESVAKELRNNGGSTALDKLQAGHAEILDELRLVRETQADTTRRLVALEARPAPSAGD